MRHTGHRTVPTKIDQRNSRLLIFVAGFPWFPQTPMGTPGVPMCSSQGTPTSEAVEESEFVGTVEVDEGVSGRESTNL